jgi:iron complex outermembrane receptor protein
MKTFYWLLLLVIGLRPSILTAQVDSIKTTQLQDLVITASRIQEGIAKSPVSIERVSGSTLQQSPAPSFFDELEHTRGVQMITPSMGFRVINTRGFSNTTDVRFVQMVNGMDNQAPHLGAPIANALGPSDLDIEHVEIIPGVASALYGMNAINGLANFLTKDPFVYTGFSIQQKVGVNRVNNTFGAKPFTETSFRWAKVFRSKFAVKINGTYQAGTDWVANSQTDLNPNANQSTGLIGADNPALDPVNSYGNESSNRRTLSLGGKNYVVARTGYYEREVVDYSLRNLKADATLSYAFKPDVTLTYTYRIANLDNVYQRSNRFRLEDYLLQQHGLAFQTNALQVRAYLNMENTGQSYNARSMAENIDRTYKSDNQWFSAYTGAFNTAVAGGVTVADAHHQARDVADTGRPVPGTPEFDQMIDELGDINDWNVGAALRVKAQMFHAEAQLDLTESFLKGVKQKTGIDLLTGLDHRTYIIVPDGNYFINPEESGSYILYGRTGGFAQASKNLFREKLKLGATLRADKNEYYPLKWNPRFTAVYSPVKHTT